MKKCVSVWLCIALLFALCAAGFAEAAAPVDVRLMSVRGNTSYTQESYEKVWITPVFVDHILTKTDEEKYPAKFITFAAPEGYTLFDYDYDDSSFINHDLLVTMYYSAFDKASFELFLEKAEEENIVKDGSDGVAIFTRPDNRTAQAMISLDEHFGRTSKLQILISDHSRDLTADDLLPMLEAEVERIQTQMVIEEPGHFWSEGQFASIEIEDSASQCPAIVDVTGLTVTKFAQDEVVTKVADGRNVREMECKIDTYSYAHYQMDDGKPEAEESALADGTPYVRYSSEYSSHAGFVVLEEGKRGPVYLTIKIDCEPDAFAELLEAAYVRISLSSDAA